MRNLGPARAHPPWIVALVLLALFVPRRSIAGDSELEVGFQIDHFGESFGAGSLFTGLEVDQPDGDRPEDEILRFETSETVPGGYLTYRWRDRESWNRRITLTGEADELSAAAIADIGWDLPLGRSWTAVIDQNLRARFRREDSEQAHDILQSLELRLERRLGRGDARAFVRHELSDISGIELYNYDQFTLGGTLNLPLQGAMVRARVDWTRKSSVSSYTGDRDAFRGELGTYGYGVSGWTWDATLVSRRRDYDGSGVVDPSSREWELRVNLERDLLGNVRAVARGLLEGADYDHPDSTYYGYLSGFGDLGLALIGFTGPGAEFTVGGEWLRPQTAGGTGWDEARVRGKLNWFTTSSLWFDLAQTAGHRSYREPSADGDVPDLTGGLQISLSDFWYTETTLLLGGRWKMFTFDTLAQYTREEHETIADDVSFVLVNSRIGIVF